MRLFLFILYFIVIVAIPNLKAQCSGGPFPECVRQKLGDYREIKYYHLDGKGGARKQIKYIQPLKENTVYRWIICSKDSASNGIILKIYNADHQLIASSYHDGKFEDILDFKTSQAGLYYAIFTFQDSKSYCGSALICRKKEP